MRGLVMDFGHDPKVANINDQYMFGPALLINPIYEYKSRSRSVYLPSGSDWYDLYSGKRFAGGKTIKADAPLKQMPIYVKAGSIIPTGPEVQFVYEKQDGPITLSVYTGADGQFELYEDDGKTYAYEKGAWSRTPISFDNATGIVTIGKRVGNFDGMPKNRTINVRWISDTRGDAADFHGKTAIYEK